MEKKIYRVKFYKHVETKKGIGYGKGLNGYTYAAHRYYEEGSLIDEVCGGMCGYYAEEFDFDTEAEAREKFDALRGTLGRIEMMSGCGSKYFLGSVLELELAHATVGEDGDVEEYDWECLCIVEGDSPFVEEDEDEEEEDED